MVMADGGVGGLLACAAAGQRVAMGPQGSEGLVLMDVGPDSGSFRATSARRQAELFGLPLASVQNPDARSGEPDRSILALTRAALHLRGLGGGELVWPVLPPVLTSGEVDVSGCAALTDRALLVSQLTTLADRSAGCEVRVTAPYADLTKRQVADLVLDMDLPIWLCWWMAASELADGPVRDEAIQERETWTRLLREAGWVGSLEAKAGVTVRLVEPRRASGQRGETS